MYLDMEQERPNRESAGMAWPEPAGRLYTDIISSNSILSNTDLSNSEGAQLDQLAARWYEGDRVMHPTFGAGTIKANEGDKKLTVLFDKFGLKKLLLSYTVLEKV